MSACLIPTALHCTYICSTQAQYYSSAVQERSDIVLSPYYDDVLLLIWNENQDLFLSLFVLVKPLLTNCVIYYYYSVHSDMKTVTDSI